MSPGMSPTAQRELVATLCDRLRDNVLKHIDDGSIPEEWDGIELRQLLAEMFWQERGFRFGRTGNFNPNDTRVRQYRQLVVSLDI